MSRNLASSHCQNCGHLVRVSELVGKPLEFRKYAYSAPVAGVRYDCECGDVYFTHVRTKDTFWGQRGMGLNMWADAEVTIGAQGGPYEKIPNEHQGKFVTQVTNHKGESVYVETGVHTVDLSYYDAYNDEPGGFQEEIDAGTREPAHLLHGDSPDTEWVWE